MVGHIEGIARGQWSLLPAQLDDYVGADHIARVIDAFVERAELGDLGFGRVIAKATGRPGYHPSDLLKLYVYGYVHGCQSSRRLEAEGLRNIEVKWLLRGLTPDFRTIAHFRHDNATAIVAVCAAFVQFCRRQGQLGSREVAIDGTKIRAVASPRGVVKKTKVLKELGELKEKIGKYLAALDEADKAESGEASLQEKAAWARRALEKLQRRKGVLEDLQQVIEASGRETLVPGEPEARPMMCNQRPVGPAYNVQTAVSTDTHLIVHFEVTQDLNDRHQLVPMAEAAQQVLALQPSLPASGRPAAEGLQQAGEPAACIPPVAASQQADATQPLAAEAASTAPAASDDGAGALQVLADSGYSNGEHAARCEALGIVACAPPQRSVNSKGLFDRSSFTYDAGSNTYVCPAGERLHFKQHHNADKLDRYEARDCSNCVLKPQCTTTNQRTVSRSWYENELGRMAQRLAADPSLMQRRRATVEHPFGTLKAIFGGRFLTRNLKGARTETALQVLAYNIKRLTALCGAQALVEALA